MKRLLTFVGFAIFLGVTGCTLRLARDISIPANSSSTTPSTSTQPTASAESSSLSAPTPLSLTPTAKTMVTHDLFTFNVTGGTPPYAFQLLSGNGTIDALTGLLTAPGTSGTGSVRVTDSNGYSGTSDLTIVAPIHVAAGSTHTCAVLSNGSIQCWGSGTSGQLGNGSNVNQNTPVYVSGISNATQVVTGASHSCALLNTGTVQCWGLGTSGQLGDGLVSTTNIPVTVSGVSTVTSLSSSQGATHTCALLSGGSVKCWGAGSVGQLGDGGATQRNSPVAVSGISTGTKVAVGSNHSCALLAAGSVQCWGSNDSGQLGDNSVIQRNTPVAVSGISTATGITAGTFYSCSVLTGGSVKCWGTAYYNQLGDGSFQGAPAGYRATPVSVSGVSTATQVMASSGLTCSTLTDGSVTCWGRRLDDISGYGTFYPPTPILGFSNVSLLSGGGGYLCGLQTDNRVKCSGSATLGQLGTGPVITHSATPVNVSGISGVVSISEGYYSTCAVLSDGTVQCWGNNSYGQLGDGTTTGRPTKAPVSGITNATSVALSASGGCAVLSTGGVKCWGYGGFTGDGTSIQRPTPVSASGITNAVAIGAGWAHFCAVLSTGSVQCWGFGFLGNLGDGAATDRLAPVTVSGISTATAVVGASHNSCALLSGGTVKCWGMNATGEAGDGTSTQRNTPVTAIGVTGATSLAGSLGYRNVCALISDGSLKCWGTDFPFLVSDLPTTAPGISNVASVAVGNGSGYVSLSDGTVKSWALVTNTFTTQAGISNVASVKYGATSTACALLSTGNMQCWGDNSHGQLGNGSTGVLMVPATVGPWQ